MGEMLQSTQWEEIVSPDLSLDEATELLVATLDSIFVYCFPKKVIRMRTIDKPWIKLSLKLLVNERDKAYSEKKTLKYLRLREKVIQLVKVLKSAYLKDGLVKDRHNLKSAWDTIKNVCGLKRVESSPLNVQEVADIFGRVFQISDPLHDLDSEALPPKVLSLSQYSVEKALKNIKRGATGSDGIPYWVLKSFASILSSPVCTVFNRSITECKVPRVFKQANILPIPKTSSTPKEYRPISLLPILSKVLERLVRDQWLLPAMRGKFDPLQFAFTPNPGSGTTCALSFITHKILEHLDTPGAVRLLLVDFSKAFDKADHAVALHSLCKFSIPREALFWIHSFLVDRKQRVVCNGQSSSWCDITSGVPQGSVLGPLIFASIIDSLKPISSSCIYVKYADDVTALNFLRTDSDDTLQLEYNHILHWSAESRLVVNNSKTHVMNMKTSSKLACGTLHDEHGSPLEVVDNARILGIIYSSNLSWNSHIERVASLCAKNLYYVCHPCWMHSRLGLEDILCHNSVSSHIWVPGMV
jgi:hypothetical protein